MPQLGCTCQTLHRLPEVRHRKNQYCFPLDVENLQRKQNGGCQGARRRENELLINCYKISIWKDQELWTRMMVEEGASKCSQTMQVTSSFQLPPNPTLVSTPGTQPLAIHLEVVNVITHALPHEKSRECGMRSRDGSERVLLTCRSRSRAAQATCAF